MTSVFESEGYYLLYILNLFHLHTQYHFINV